MFRNAGYTFYLRLVAPNNSMQSKRPASPGLLSHVSEQSASKKLPLALRTNVTIHGNTREQLVYTIVSSVEEFQDLEQRFPPQKRSFFEIVLGNYPHRPYFDIECESATQDQAQEALNAILDAIANTLSDLGIDVNPTKDFLVTSSHGESKKSFHIVLPYLVHRNNEEAKALCTQVCSRLSPSMRSWVDRSMYKSKQQFRVLGSQKPDSGRVKKLAIETYHGKPLNQSFSQNALPFSLVQFGLDDCNFLPHIALPKKQIRATEDLTEAEISLALQICAKYGKFSSAEDKDFPYEFRDSVGRVINLRRKRPTKCPMCLRVHDHENPFLLVSKNDASEKKMDVHFSCRRCETMNLLKIGSIRKRQQQDEEDEPPRPAQSRAEVFQKINALSSMPLQDKTSKNEKPKDERLSFCEYASEL
jgi:hypothetical protein